MSDEQLKTIAGSTIIRRKNGNGTGMAQPRKVPNGISRNHRILSSSGVADTGRSGKRVSTSKTRKTAEKDLAQKKKID